MKERSSTPNIKQVLLFGTVFHFLILSIYYSNAFFADHVKFYQNSELLGTYIINEDVAINGKITNTMTKSKKDTNCVKDNDDNETIAVFYNVYTETQDNITYVKSIVDEQLSNLLPQHKVFVRSIGVPFDIQNTTLMHHDANGDEPETLKLLWDYCQYNPTGKVVYIHTKGSYHRSKENDRLRRFLTRGALSEECANLPSTCNVCSSRMSPVPHPHTSGNMWLARCDYVQRLINPRIFENKMENVPISKIGNKGWSKEWGFTFKDYWPCIGIKRFASEHWVHSHPTVMPCDLSDDKKFVWDYKNIPSQDFEIDLMPAPRFDLKKYKYTGQCLDWGFIVEDRLLEYISLYGEEPPDSWWGWKLFSVASNSKK